MAKTKNTGSTKYWQGHRETGSLIVECKYSRHSGSLAAFYKVKHNFYPMTEQAHSWVDALNENSSSHKNLYTNVYSSSSQIAPNWKPKYPSKGESKTNSGISIQWNTTLSHKKQHVRISKTLH